MSTWTSSETDTLIRLWPVGSARQIASTLQRSRSAVSRKAQRLCVDGVLPRCGAKHFAVKPMRARPTRKNHSHDGHSSHRMMPSKPTPPADDSLAMRPCAFAELDDGRCHWPIDSGSRITTVFCGGATAPGRLYCLHHSQMARGEDRRR